TGVSITLVSPADSAATNDTTPAFSWTGDADTYSFQLSTVADFSSIAESTVTASSAFTASEHPADTYYWRVIASDAAGNVETSPARSLFIDTEITVTAATPADGVDTNVTPPTFTWTGTADTYRIQISRLNDFSSITVETVTAATVFTPSSPLGEDTYYWRVGAWDRAGNAETTAARSFHIDTSVAVALVSPAAFFQSNDTTPTFTWSGDADTFILQVSTVSDFSALFDSTTTAMTTFTATQYYPQDTYYWRVGGMDRLGNADTTAARILFIDTGLIINLLSPADSTATNDTTPTFQWSGNGDTFLFQISRVAAFTSLFDSFTSTTADSYTPVVPYPEDTYYWRVATRDNSGNQDTTVSRILWIDTTPPAAAVLVSPADSAATNDPMPTFTWTANAETSVIEVSTSPAFASLAFVETTTATTATPTSRLPQDTYSWRVHTIDAAGNRTAATTVRTLFIDTSISVALSAPADNALTNDSTPTFTWTGDADTYTIEITTDPAFGSINDSAILAATTHTAAPLPADTYFWRVRATDRAGNNATSSTRTLVIDTGVSVSLSSPADSSATNDSTPTFSWTGDADTYTIEVATDFAFASIVDSAVLALTTHTTSALPEGTYFWRVTGRDAAGNVETTPVRNFAIDTSVTVTLVSPADGTLTNDSTPTFSWTSDGETFTIEVSTSPAFAGLFDSALLNTTSYSTVGVYPQDTYYWRVVASDAAGNIETSASRTLVIDTAISLSLVSPADGTVSPDSVPDFVWFGNADTFVLDVSLFSNFAILFDSVTTAGTTVTASRIYPNGIYYWRVSAYDAAGNAETVSYRTLTVDTDIAVTAVTPADFHETNVLQPTFLWNGNADTYRWELALDAAFAAVLDSATTSGTSAQPVSPLVQDTYYWRVRAVDNAGNQDTTPTRTLLIDTQINAALVSPAADSQTNDSTPTFVWTGDADSYTLEISTDPAFGFTNRSVTLAALSYTETAGLVSDSYYWRIIARDRAGNLLTTSPRRIEIDTIINVTLVSPADATQTNDTTPSFSWTGDADTYLVQIATAAAFSTISESTVTTGTSFTASGLAADTYFWRVAGLDNAENAETTPSRTLFIITAVTVTLQNPADSFQTNNTQPTFSWITSGETSFFQIATDNLFGTIVDSTVTTGTSYTPAGSYPADTYYWRVGTVDAADNSGTSTVRILFIDTGISVALVAPADNFLTNDSTPTFTWTGDADSYTFSLAADSTFATLLDSAVTTLTTYTPASGYPQATYYWKVVAQDAAGNVDQTPSRALTIDTEVSVSLGSPADGKRTNIVTPVFTWAGTADTFRIEIATDAAFTAIVQTVDTSLLSYTASPLVADTYYWRVIASDAASNVETSPLRTLVVDTDIALVLPASDFETNATIVTFTWSGTADTYWFQASTDSTFAALIDSNTPSAATAHTPAAPYPQGTYYWRVTGWDVAGNFDTADYRILIIDTSVAVALDSPIDGFETNSAPAFSWTSDGDTFLFQTARDTSFLVLGESVATTATTYTPASVPPEDTWYWRVIAVDNATNVDTSAVRSFVIDTSVSVALTSPADLFETNDTTPIFSWTGDADTYLLEVSNNDPTFNTLVETALTNSGTHIVPDTRPLPAGIYYWRVTGTDQLGNVSIAAARTLYVDTSVRVTLSTPADGTVTTVNRPVFTVTGDADTYLFQISTSASFATLFDTSSTDSTSYQPLFSYPADTYYWRAIGFDNAGNVETSGVRSIVITTGIAVTLVAPPDAVDTSLRRPTFSWTGNADTYLFELSTDPAFAFLIDSATTTSASFTPTAAYPRDTYYWRVTGTDSGGGSFTTSAWSIHFVPNLAVSLGTPADSTVTALTAPTFTWSGNADTYLFELSTDPTFALLTDSSSTTGASYTPLSSYAADTYYWRVTAQDSLSAAVRSAVRTLIIDTSGTLPDSTPPFAQIISIPSDTTHVTGTALTLATGFNDSFQKVLFEYRLNGAVSWNTVPVVAGAGAANPDTSGPFWSTVWDLTGFADGLYEVRATATLNNGTIDSTPEVIAVMIDSASPVIREYDDTTTGDHIRRQIVIDAEYDTVLVYDGTELRFPAGVLSPTDSTWVRMEILTTPPPEAPGAGAFLVSPGAGSYRRFTLENGQTNFSGEVTIVIPYDESTLTVPESTLAIYYYDEAAGAWIKIDNSVVNEVENYVSARVTHFTLYAVFGAAAAANLSNVIIYPNPFRPNDGNAQTGRAFVPGDNSTGLIFGNVTSTVDIEIFNMAGRRISAIHATNTGGNVQWDVKNDDGRDVASGVYFAIIRSPNGDRVVKKFMVIR
ncbi:MAG: T9SS C-terminal target domain-containing protein, partial [Candidatus Hydrogenedentota bacterium]